MVTCWAPPAALLTSSKFSPKYTVCNLAPAPGVQLSSTSVSTNFAPSPGLGLYAVYQQEGAAFLPRYDGLLRSTGEATAADLAARFGIDIRQRAFWESSLAVISARIDRYLAL